MAQLDAAKIIKTALAQAWDGEQYTATLHVEDDFTPQPGSPVLLVADDGGAPVTGGAWLAGKGMLRITIRLTAFAAGRTEARELLDTAVDFLFSDRPAGIVRIENVPAALDTRDRETGAYLASITVPVTVRPPV